MLRSEKIVRGIGRLPYLVEVATVLVFVFVSYGLGLSIARDMRLPLVSIVAGTLATLWVLFAGRNLRRTVVLLLILLILAPGVRLSPRLPVIFGTEIIIFVVGGLLLMNIATQHRLLSERRLAPTGFLLALFIPMTALSMGFGYAGFGIAPTKGDWFEFVKIAQYVLAFYIASQVRLREGHLRFLSKIIVVAISISAILGLLQVFDVGGTREFFANFFFSASQASGSGGASPNVVSSLTRRVAGTVGNPNQFGFLLAVGLIFGVVLLLGRAVRGPMLLVLGVSNSLILVTLLLTGSRTAAVAALVAGAYLGITMPLRRRRFAQGSLMSSRKVRLVLFATPVLLAIVFINVGGGLIGDDSAIITRIGRTMSVDIQGRPVQNRIETFKIGLSQAAESPILGYGPAEGSPELVHSRDTDNEIIFVLLRYGAVGLLLFVAFWLSSLRLARSCQRLPNGEASMFGQAVTAVVILDLVIMWPAHSFFDIRQMTLTCILLGLCVAARSWLRSTRTAQQEQLAPPHEST